MLLSKEANTKDTQQKSQLLLSFKDDDKDNFPEITLTYVNQACVSLVKGGEKAIYYDYVILAQIMPLANIDPLINLDMYEPKDNEVVIYVPMPNTVTGLYYGLTKKLGMITLRGDAQERFFFLRLQ